MNTIFQVKEYLSLSDNTCLDKSPIDLKTRAQKSVRRGKSETVKSFYSPLCAVSIKHSRNIRILEEFR